MSIWNFPSGEVKFFFAASRICATASSGRERSAWTDAQRIECWVAREVQRSSVRDREDSEVKFNRREQPFEARFRAMASPIPWLIVSWIDEGMMSGLFTARTAGDDAEFSF